MNQTTEFNGFTQDTLRLYSELSKNNDRLWFENNKEIYRTEVIKPAVEFVKSMGARLQSLSPRIVADTRTNGSGSIFRVYRDVRFSKDKRPYKTFLGIFFWEGENKKMNNPGFYFHLEPKKLMLFAGMHEFSKDRLGIYRNAVVDSENLKELESIKKEIIKGSSYELGGRHYKRIPRGYESHENNQFLLHNGLYAYCESDIPEELFSAALVEYCFKRFEHMQPLHNWLVANIGG